ncbi:MAG: hypothetical protein QOG40_2071 [Solirubrobacteraceae bacterium]|nr:hypothetical protein [Solirubrobacteraceae bacterium]
MVDLQTSPNAGSKSTPPAPSSSAETVGKRQYSAALLHFIDLRDGTHGGARSQDEKERLYTAAVELLDPYARQALEELNSELMLHTGEVLASGVRRIKDGGVEAVWTLSWPAQRAARVGPVLIRAYFGSGFLHPHLQSATVGDWPLNVFDDEQAAAELPTLRALATADIHNLVFQLGGDHRIVPATIGERTYERTDDDNR